LPAACEKHKNKKDFDTDKKGGGPESLSYGKLPAIETGEEAKKQTRAREGVGRSVGGKKRIEQIERAMRGLGRGKIPLEELPLRGWEKKRISLRREKRHGNHCAFQHSEIIAHAEQEKGRKQGAEGGRNPGVEKGRSVYLGSRTLSHRQEQGITPTGFRSKE